MTLKEFLNAYADRHGWVVIKNERDWRITSGDSWAFVVEQAEYMGYNELHEKEVDCFSFSDNILYIRLKGV